MMGLGKGKLPQKNGNFGIFMCDFRGVAPEKWWLEEDPFLLGFR